MALVAGIDSSTQSCKVFVRDAESGELVRQGRASHPDGTEIDPQRWKDALDEAVAAAGGLDDVDAVSVGAQQHGMVCLDETGTVVRKAVLWNDTRSAQAATDLVSELGKETGVDGGQAWADAVGVVPLASITVAKLRWLADHEPENADRTAAVCLPHDWLSWQLGGASGLDSLATDRGDASGTGYFSAASNEYRTDRSMGVLPAAPDSMSTALAEGRDVIVWPGGEVDSLRPWSKRDEATLGGRTGFIKLAIRTGVPIVPVATVGGADAMPVLIRGDKLAKVLKLDKIARLKVFPIAISLPWIIAPAALPQIPLPAKIRTRFMPPVELDYDPARCEDEAYVDAKYDEVRASIQSGMDALASKRKFPVFG